MRLSEKSNLQLQSYTRKGNSLRPASFAQSPDQINLLYNRYLDDLHRKRAATISPYVVEKPDWFRAAERRARRFVRTIGIEAAKGAQITCIDVSTPEEYDTVLDEGSYEENILAVNAPGVGILVPLERAAACIDEPDGSTALTSTITHELVHAAEHIEPRLSEVYDGDNNKAWLGYNARHGLTITKLDDYLGTLYQEGICNVVGGLYVRRLADRAAWLCSIDTQPLAERPAFYTQGMPAPPEGKPYGMGYDAYTLEMISWKAWMLGATASKHTLLEDLLASHSTDATKRLAAFRAIPQAINSVQPGLYRELQHVKRDRFVWQDTMKHIHDIVVS